MLRMVESACTYDDRLSDRYLPCDTADGAARVTFDQWRDIVARSDHALFERRLQWDALDEAAARRLLMPFRLSEATAVPPWAETFRAAFGGSAGQVAARFSAVGAAAADEAFDPAEPVAFEELFAPALAHARESVHARVGAAWTLLLPSAQVTMQRALLRRLSHVCGRALYAGFSTFRLARQRESIAFLFAPAGSRSDGIYRDYVERMQVGELYRFFEEYPVAARLCARLIELWIDATAEFIERLAADAAGIADRFGDGMPVGAVAGVHMGAGDAHDGGRAVIIADFASGLRLVYKPRPLGLEEFHAGFVDWLNRQPGLTLPLRAVRVWARGAYGWVEYVAQQECTTIEQIRQFYHRTGAVLAVVHALNGNDFHFENLIAAGEHPVLIDLEALVMHRFVMRGLAGHDGGSAQAARELHAQSVLKTGLLPILHRSQDEWRAIDLGGMASAQGAEVSVQITYWRHPNTDLMKLAEKPVEIEQKPNIPRLQGTNQYARDYVAEIAAGFESTYRVLLAGRSSLSALLGTLGDQTVRFLFRRTNLYSVLLERALHPAFLRGGADRFVQLDVLSRPLLTAQERPSAWAVLGAERASLEQLDIPCFSARAGSRSLELPSGAVLPDFFERSACEDVFAKIAALSQDDMEFQLQLLRMALHASAARGAGAPYIATQSELEQDGPPAISLHELHELAHAEARAVTRGLRAHGITVGDEVSWFGVGYLPRTRRHVAGSMAYTLADGYCGVGLFLAALARCTRSEADRALALAAIRPLRTQLGEIRTYTTTRSQVDTGIANGLGSAIYALTRIARLIDEPVLLDEAAVIAAALTPDLIASDTAYDVSAGVAGALLALLTLYQATGDASSLAAAVNCGDHLLARSQSDPRAAGLTWPTAGATCDVGFAHGAAGIGAALARLARESGVSTYADAARQAVAHDRALLGGTDLGDWAEGVTGLGFAELELGWQDGDRSGLDHALTVARRHLSAGPDGLASGALGRADLLLTAGVQRADQDLIETARIGAARIVYAARQRGHYRTGWGDDFCHLGLFHGLTGVAYELLRLAAPAEVPSVLTWQ